jgi:hypothetical protein
MLPAVELMYESDVRYPTDVKLLWESCSYIYEELLFPICRRLGSRRPRNKFKEQQKKQLIYSKRRKSSYKLRRKRLRTLLYLLEKGLSNLQDVLNLGHIELREKERLKLRTIRIVHLQQQYMFVHKVNQVADRIISLSKPWLRPIKRGKETKMVEYGHKAHLLQVGGICLIDHLASQAYHEGNRLKIAYYKHQTIFGSCTHLGADQIYANNKNRKFITAKGIITNFRKKGRPSADPEEKRIKSIIAKERATRMEGAFGTHKRNYGLDRVKARTEKNEKLLIFFGVMTANAVLISKNKNKNKSNSYHLAA